MPGQLSGQMATRSRRRLVASALLSCRLYVACATGPHRPSESATDLRHPFPGRLADSTDDRPRPAPSGSQDRVLGHPSHLGSKPDAPSPSALCRPRWRAWCRRKQLGQLPPQLLFARACAQPCLEGKVSSLSGSPLSHRRAFLSRTAPVFGLPRALENSAQTTACNRLGGLFQASLRRARAGSQVSGSIHPSGGHFQPATAVISARPGELALQRLPAGGRSRTLVLQQQEFIRRFLLHALPTRFVRIRSYGFLANRCRRQKLALCRRLLAPIHTRHPQPETSLSCADTPPLEQPHLLCPVCGQGPMLRVDTLLPTPYRIEERIHSP